ncbi:MAG: hypothetical protein KDD38_04160 [Bdellovibrionales bacterium]|nr:hypothetical protein [Bdellovibrionales bacterium]
MKYFALLFVGLFAVQLSAKSLGHPQAKPLALIYKGPGSCVQSSVTMGCSEASAVVARAAGFDVEYIGPKLPADLTLFTRASVWIQPGGRARVQVAEMEESLKQKIRDFIKSGKGYVGFCAGGFLASEKFGWNSDKDGEFEVAALGLIPGMSRYYDFFDDEISEENPAKIISTYWLNVKRDVYWELGPYFNEDALSGFQNSEVVARYPSVIQRPSALDKKPEGSGRLGRSKNIQPIMSLRGEYYGGRVYVTAVHPEAPQDWRNYYKLNDNDGLDIDLAKEMVLWAARLNSN